MNGTHVALELKDPMPPCWGSFNLGIPYVGQVVLPAPALRCKGVLTYQRPIAITLEQHECRVAHIQRLQKMAGIEIPPLENVIVSQAPTLKSRGLIEQKLLDFTPPLANLITMSWIFWQLANKATPDLFPFAVAAADTGADKAPTCVIDVANKDNSDTASCSQDENPIEICKAIGISEKDIPQIIDAYQEWGIPFNEKTAPRFHDGMLKGPLKLFEGDSNTRAKVALFSHYRAEYVVDGKPRRYFFKIFHNADIASRKAANIQAGKSGIDLTNPQGAVRNLLASLLAEQLGWDIIPKMRIGVTRINNKLTVGLVSEEVPGTSMANLKKNEFIDVFRKDDDTYPRLAVLFTLFGDIDRHASQLFVEERGDGLYRMKSMDFDHSFGHKFIDTNEMNRLLGDHVLTLTPHMSIRAIQEFMQKMTSDIAANLAAGLLSRKEIRALKARVHYILGYFKKLGETGNVKNIQRHNPEITDTSYYARFHWLWKKLMSMSFTT